MRIAAAPLCALSAVVLALEVFQSRLVAYCVQNVMIYAVVGVALLGFGAAGSLVALRQTWLQQANLPKALAWSALSFSASIVVAHALFVRLTPHLIEVDAASLGIAALLGLPFLAAGTVITLALSAASNPSAAYAANLIGSGLGCFLPLLLLRPLDGEHLLGLLALLAWLGALPYVRDAKTDSRALVGASVGVFALALASLVFAPAVFPIKPDPPPWGQLQGQYDYAAAHGIKITKRYDRWNPTGRIEIIQFDNVPGEPSPYHAMFYAQDSTAGSTLFRWDGRTKSQTRPSAHDAGSVVSRMCTETLYGQGYFAPRRRVLVIGLGGGPDLQCALYQEAESIDVVEINPDSIAAIQGPLSSWAGGIGSNAHVRFHNRDGRSFVHDRVGPFDLIQLSGVDTKNNLASGALALSENLLYTQEAFRDYLRRLSPNGALSIIRFGEPEALRLAHTAILALRELGVSDPQRHIAIARTGVGFGVVVRRQAWTEAEAAAFEQQLHPPFFRGFSVYYYNQNGLPFDKPAEIQYLPPRPTTNAFGAFFVAEATGQLAPFQAWIPWDISATSDDRPFFFDIWRYDRGETWHAPHVVTLRNLLLSIVLLSVLLIVLPLRGLRRRGSSGSKPWFFACIGCGFVLLEVWLLHRFTTYLGHQVYALSVVLATLLVSTGVGAGLGKKALPSARARILVGCVGAALVCIALLAALPPILEATWHAALPVRAAIAILVIAPLGVLLGQPFVGGLAWLGTRNPEGLPWCIGINGLSSVIASVGVIPLLMALGYSGSLVAGIACYLLAALAALGMGTQS